MEWAIPPNLQYTQGVFQIPTKRKQLTTVGPWDLPKSNFIRNPMRSSFEGFQSTALDDEIKKNLKYFTDTYKKGLTILDSKDIPIIAKDLIDYYSVNTANGTVGIQNMAESSPWDTEFKYYRFIFSDPEKCNTGSQSKTPEFAIEFHSLGRSKVATIATQPRVDKSIDNVESQKYSNGVLLVRFKTKQSFSGIKWGSGNTDANKTPPIMTTWLLQASNNDSVWQDLNIADVFNELIQKDTTRLTELNDSTKKAYTTNQITIYSKTALNRQIDQALRALLGAAIDRFRAIYIQLPASIQSNLAFIFAQYDKDKSDTFDPATPRVHIEKLVKLYFGIPYDSQDKVPSYHDQFVSQVQKNLQQTIKKTQDLAKLCLRPSSSSAPDATSGPTGSLSVITTVSQDIAALASSISDDDVNRDLAIINAPAAASTVSLNNFIKMYTGYTSLAQKLTKSVDSQSRLDEFNTGNQGLDVLFKIPDTISKTSFADSTFNGYRTYLNNKLQEFYNEFMYTTTTVKDTTLDVGSPSSSQQQIPVPVPYREYYDASIVDLYTTNRSTGISKGKQDYDSIWVPLTSGETATDRIAKLRKLEALYDSYTQTLISSKKIAQERYKTLSMINYFEECYMKVIAAIPEIGADMQPSITIRNIQDDKTTVSKMEDTNQLANIFTRYNNLMYSNRYASENTEKQNDLLYCMSKRLKEQYDKFWTNYLETITYTNPNTGTKITEYSKDFRRYVRDNADSKYVQNNISLYNELEAEWSKDPNKLIKKEYYKPTAVAGSLGGPLILAGSPSGAPSSSLVEFGSRNAPGQSSSWDTNVKKAIETLLSQKNTGIRIIKKTEFKTITEESIYDTATTSISFVLEIYEYLWNANDLLTPVKAEEKGRGFIQRVKDCIELDAQRPKVIYLIENYKSLYDTIIKNYDPITTNQFINKVYGYDISGYVVNEIDVMRPLGFLDEYNTTIGQLTTEFKDVKVESVDSNKNKTVIDFPVSTYPGFSLYNLRITGATMNGKWTSGDIGSVGTRISRYSITDTKAEFILSSDFVGGDIKYFTMVMITISYTKGTTGTNGILKVKAEEARAEYVSISTTNMTVQKDLNTLWDETLTKDGGYEKSNRKNTNTPAVPVATTNDAEGYGITNLKLGYRNFRTDHDAKLKHLKEINILERTGNFAVSSAPSSSGCKPDLTSISLIEQIANIQACYYTQSGGESSGYFATLLNYVAEISKAYITKLDSIHKGFDSWINNVFINNWNNVGREWDKIKAPSHSHHKPSYETIRSIQGTPTFTGGFNDKFTGEYESNTGRITTMLNANTNIGYINTFTTNPNINYITNDIFNWYLNPGNRYKNALLAITTYNFWKVETKKWLDDTKTKFNNEYNGYYNASFKNVMNPYIDTYYGKTSADLLRDTKLDTDTNPTSDLYSFYNLIYTANNNRNTLVDQYTYWDEYRKQAEDRKTAFNTSYDTYVKIPGTYSLPDFMGAWYNNGSTTFTYTDNWYWQTGWNGNYTNAEYYREKSKLYILYIDAITKLYRYYKAYTDLINNLNATSNGCKFKYWNGSNWVDFTADSAVSYDLTKLIVEPSNPIDSSTDTNLSNLATYLTNVKNSIVATIGYANSSFNTAFANFKWYAQEITSKEWFTSLLNNGFEVLAQEPTEYTYIKQIANSSNTIGVSNTVDDSTIGNVPNLFNAALSTFRTDFGKIQAFENMLTGEFFKKRRTFIASNSSLSNYEGFYDKLHYLLVGGGGGGGGPHNSNRGGGGGGSGYFVMNTNGSNFGSYYYSGNQITYKFSNIGNTNDSSDPLNIDSSSIITVFIGDGGNGVWGSGGATQGGYRGGNTRLNVQSRPNPNASYTTTEKTAAGGRGGSTRDGNDNICYNYDGIQSSWNLGGCGANSGGAGVGKSSNSNAGESNFGGSSVGGRYSGGGGGDNAGGSGGGGIGGGTGGIGASTHEACNGHRWYPAENGTSSTGAGGGGGATNCEHLKAGSGGSGYAVVLYTRTTTHTSWAISTFKSSSGFQNQTPYNKPQVERKILVNSLNTLDFSGNPVVPYTFDKFLHSLKSWSLQGWFT